MSWPVKIALITPLLFLTPHIQAQGVSVVPSEACIDGDPIQVLNFDELPLTHTPARNMAERAGNWQNRSRYTILTGVLVGAAFFLGGASVGILRLDSSNPAPASTAFATSALGLGFGAAGVSLGRFGLKYSTSMATEALTLEEDATFREARWRSEDLPCSNE